MRNTHSFGIDRGVHHRNQARGVTASTRTVYSFHSLSPERKRLAHGRPVTSRVVPSGHETVAAIPAVSSPS
jgi:hypothetical protein